MASTLPAPGELAALTGKYNLNIISPKVQMALLVMAKMWELKNDSNQTDYTTNQNQLAIDAERACIGITREDLKAAQVGKAWAIAASITGAPNTLNSQIASLGQMVNRSDDELDRMNLLLEFLLQNATGD